MDSDVRSCYKCPKIPKLSCVSCPRALCKFCSERVKFRRLKGRLILCSVCVWLELLVKEKKDADLHMYLAGIDGEPWKITRRKKLQKEVEKLHGCGTLPEKEMKYASIDPKNIDVVYLRKSLVEKLMQEPIESYNRKLTGSFVKIRLVQQSSYMLVQVIGVRWTQNGCCKLLWEESGKEEVVGISLLTDRDVSEDDCKELKLRIRRGLRKWPTVAEIEEKARSLHEDITNHWIAKLLDTLEKRIARAEETGLTDELSEYLERKGRLLRLEVQTALLNDIPNVVADEAGGICSVDMSSLRAETHSNFDTADSNHVYRNKTDECDNFVENGSGMVHEAETYCSNREHRASTQLGINPSKNVNLKMLHSQDHFNNVKALNLIETAMSSLQRMSKHPMPPIFYKELAPFLTAYDDFMTEFRGPSKERFEFSQNVVSQICDDDTHVEDHHTNDSMIVELSAPSVIEGANCGDVGRSEDETIVGEDITDRCPVDLMIVDSTAPPIVQIARGGVELKGVLTRPLKKWKVKWLDENWWSEGANLDAIIIRNEELNYTLTGHLLHTIKPGQEFEDSVIDAYMVILREREKIYQEKGDFKNAESYFFMPSHFWWVIASYCAGHSEDPMKRPAKNLKDLKQYFIEYSTHPRGQPIHQCSYIFFPCNTGNHYVLFIWAVAKWKITIVDPLCDNVPLMPLRDLYRDQFYVMEKIIPCMLRYLNPDGYERVILSECNVMHKRPKQLNTIDCGVFVCKYMDSLLNSIDLESESTVWSQSHIDMFRYRIAHELKKGVARHFSETALNGRIARL